MKQIDFNCIAGKTITDDFFYDDYSSSIVLKFTDGTYSAIEFSIAYDNIEIDTMTSLNDYEKLNFKLISKEEYDQIKIEQDVKRKEELKKRDLKYLRELQEKYKDEI